MNYAFIIIQIQINNDNELVAKVNATASISLKVGGKSSQFEILFQQQIATLIRNGYCKATAVQKLMLQNHQFLPLNPDVPNFT